MFDRILSSTTTDQLVAGIRFAARRHDLIANNIANIVTPGYKAVDLDLKCFDEAMEALGKGTKFDAASALREIPSPDAGPVKPNGNNVDIDREMSKLSRNALLHNSLVSLLAMQIRSLKSTLREEI